MGNSCRQGWWDLPSEPPTVVRGLPEIVHLNAKASPLLRLNSHLVSRVASQLSSGNLAMLASSCSSLTVQHEPDKGSRERCNWDDVLGRLPMRTSIHLLGWQSAEPIQVNIGACRVTAIDKAITDRPDDCMSD